MQKIEVNKFDFGNELVLLLEINGYAQLDSITEPIYHEVAIHGGGLFLHESPKKVLILGGGDGCAAREALKHIDCKISLIDIDEEMLDLAKTHPDLVALNNNSLNDERVKVYCDDAKRWIKKARKNKFDFIFADFPDPSNPTLAKLFSAEYMYKELFRILKPNGALVIQVGGILMNKLHKFVTKELALSGFKTVIPIKADGVLKGVQLFLVACPREKAIPGKSPWISSKELQYMDEKGVESALSISSFWLNRIKKADINNIHDAFTAWAEDTIASTR